MPFLDYRSLVARRRYCFAEVRLNRRLAPRLYLGVRAIVPHGDGFVLADADRSDAIEFAVEMNRIPRGQTLAERLAAGRVVANDIDRVGQSLAQFHAGAQRSPGAAPFADQLHQCLDALTECRPVRLVRELCGAVTRLEGDRATELAERVRRGLVRDGHGDLRAEHFVLGDPIQIFDCVEFDANLRQTDVVQILHSS